MSLLNRTIIGTQPNSIFNLLCCYTPNFAITMKITNASQISETVNQVVKEQDDKVCTISIQNKSRLREEHRNILFGTRPYCEPKAEHHLTLKYIRKMYGRYGNDSGVNPATIWPSKDEIKERKEYEKVAFPFSIQELVHAAEKEKQAKEQAIQEQHERVESNMAKLELWKAELKSRIAKKEAEALAARAKKEKLIEEVRRHFGFTVDPKDDRFKEMLAVKEKEQRKKEKKVRTEERERKAIAKLMNKHNVSSAESKADEQTVISN